MLYQGVKNQFMLFGFATEYLVTILLTYSQGINIVFGTRDLAFIHFGLMGLPFCMIENIWDEIRKYLIRNVPKVSLN